MKRLMVGSRLLIAGTVGAALLAAGALGLGAVALGQDQSAATTKDVIFARKILMDTINENMDDLEAMVASGKIDMNEGRDHSNIVSVMLMAFPHMFPPASNEWKPNAALDPGTDTFASPDLWSNFTEFYKMSDVASKAAFEASRARTEDEFKKSIGNLRGACDGCHARFLKKQ
jgi:cytochrome c556